MLKIINYILHSDYLSNTRALSHNWIMAIDVPIFRFLNKEQGKTIAKAFKIIKCKKGETVLTYGEPVPGIFSVVEGVAEIFTGNFDPFLTKLEYGNTIGEMSLIENRTASANVRVSQDDTVLLLCKSDDFRKVLNDDLIWLPIFTKVQQQAYCQIGYRFPKKIEIQFVP